MLSSLANLFRSLLQGLETFPFLQVALFSTFFYQCHSSKPMTDNKRPLRALLLFSLLPNLLKRGRGKCEKVVLCVAIKHSGSQSGATTHLPSLFLILLFSDPPTAKPVPNRRITGTALPSPPINYSALAVKA